MHYNIIPLFIFPSKIKLKNFHNDHGTKISKIKIKVSTCWQSRSRGEGPSSQKSCFKIVYELNQDHGNGPSPKTVTA